MPTTTTSENLAVTAAESVAQLSRSERGRAVLRAIADVSMDISGLDRANAEALCAITEVFRVGRINGSVLDLLRPFKSKPSAK